MMMLRRNAPALSMGIVCGLVIHHIISISMTSTYRLAMSGRDYREVPAREQQNEVGDPSESLSLKDAEHIIMDDSKVHKDDDSIARDLYSKVRILCWIMTAPQNLLKKAIHVKSTWGKRCNILLFMSDEDNATFPAVGLHTEPGRGHLTAKTMRAFDYIFKNHFDDADWFLKADDDTYVIVENLRYMLSVHDPNKPMLFGHHFNARLKAGYVSGGAGYVISKEALSRFGKRQDGDCAKDLGDEDVVISECMDKFNVWPADSTDSLNRSRFHCFHPEKFVVGDFPSWYYKRDMHGAQKGIGSMSDYPVSFHYVKPAEMYLLEYYTYHMKVYGVLSGIQDLNKKTSHKR